MAKKAKSSSSIGTPLEEKAQHLKVLYYGKQGTGKTTAAALATQSTTGDSRVLIIDAEGGLDQTALATRGVDTSRVAVWPPVGQRVTSEGLMELHEALDEELADDPESWSAVVFDSMTEIHQLLRENATDYRVEKSRVVIDPDVIDRDDYNKMTSQMRKIIRRFRDLPCDIVFTALEKITEDEIRPAVSPALGTDLMGYVDLVIRTAMVQDSQVGRFHPTEHINAKDRTNQFPALMANPSFDRLCAVRNNILDLDSDDAQQALVDQSKPQPESNKE